MASDTATPSSASGEVTHSDNNANSVSDAISAAAATATQTRFSFYDAQEVQLQISASENKDEPASDSRFNFYDDKTRQELAEVKINVPGASGDSTDDILRSLQETEEQRIQILKAEPTKPATKLSTRIEETPIVNVMDSPEQGDENDSNPYEDAIKEALDLLRKHRSPVSTPSSEPPLTVQLEPSRPRTPKEQDRLLQHRMDGDGEHENRESNGNTMLNAVNTEALTDVYEEHKLKAKLRQERMARYASRLQEFKSSLPAETMETWQISNADPNIEANMNSDRGPIRQVGSVNDESTMGFSDLSQSTKQQMEEEVQKGVERVLLAILEQANSSRGRGAKASEDSESAVQKQDSLNDALLRAVDDVLCQQSELVNSSDAKQPLDSQRSICDSETTAGRRSAAERSVVDELLAEVDCQDDGRIAMSVASPAFNDPLFGQPWSGYQEEKKLPDSHEKTNSKFPNHTIHEESSFQVSEDNADDTIDEILRSSVEQVTDDEYADTATESTGDRDEGSGTDGGYSDEDGSQTSGEYDSSERRVLGPLSQKAGGTTGVVLDIDQDNEADSQDEDSSNILGPFSTVVNYVASALNPDQEAVTANNKSPMAGDKYAIRDDEECDVEATELMRTLCAHLLPFGVDQSNRLLESIPDWDENNPNEAGYRIIRLSKTQLRRVETAFETMITGLKKNSERQLNDIDTSGLDGYDANFVKELQEAERLLDDEEKRVKAVETAKNSGDTSSASGATLVKELALDAPDDKSVTVDTSNAPCHQDFPGVKGTGQGEMGDLEYFHLPIIFKSHVTGFEPTKDLVLEPGNVVAGQYLVESELGSAAFSTAYRCIDLSSDGAEGHEEVCLKVIKNTKDFFDQSLDEIKILELLRQTGQVHKNHIIEMKTFFYYREHLFIVTELLRQNLFEFGKFILDNNEEPYFTLERLAYVTRQALIALQFVHSLGLVHSDVKPENILLGSYSRSQIKLIDFGSSCYLTDRQSSYIQSRSYRAPEVVLGLPYDGKIDVWSLGCVVAEMFTGEVTFQNDSIASMLSRIEAICGPFPRHMIAQGRQSGRFFTSSGLLYEVVGESDRETNKSAPGPHDTDSDCDAKVQFDIFQPKKTRFCARLGFDGDLMDDFDETSRASSFSDRRQKQLFTDFVSRMLTIDPDGRPNAQEALEHPWMQYAASLTEEEVKYPSS